MGEIYVETYRGCEIYRYTPPDVPETVYGSPCIVGQYFTISAVRKRICAATGGLWVDGACTAAPPPPTLPFPCPVCGFLFDTEAALQAHIASRHLDKPIEVYRDVEIWWITSLNMFRAQVSAGYVAVEPTLPLIRAAIDEILEFLNPPEDPEEGLFAQVVAAVKVWALENMPGWVLEWGQNIYNTVTNIVENITNVYNEFAEYVTNVYNDTYEYISNSYNYWSEYITNSYTYWTEEVTNIYNNTYQNITNVVGASMEWVDQKLQENRDWMMNFAKLMDPMGFLKDPLGFINAAFALQGEIANNLAVKSFWEGFEEGLAEEAG